MYSKGQLEITQPCTGDHEDDPERRGIHYHVYGHYAVFPYPVVYLPHSCDEWVIGGPEHIQALIDDLTDVLNAPAISAQEIYGPNSLMQAFGGTPQTVTTEQVNSELDSLSGRMSFTNRQLTELYFNSLTRRGKEILTQQAIDELEAQEQGND